MGTEVNNAEESIRLLIEDLSVRENSSKQDTFTICKVPNILRDLNSSAYTPRITSIGPLHKEDQGLIAMEKHKVTYMYRLFCRTMKSRNYVQQITNMKDIETMTHGCIQEVLGFLPRVRDCYTPASLINYEDLKLAEIMVTDGCFILELLFTPLDKIGVCDNGNISCDPIFDYVLVLRDIKHDLLLLENQIPFFVLEKLFEITMQPFSESITLTRLVFSFFNDMDILNNRLITAKKIERCQSCYQVKRNEETKEETVEPCHILGLLQSCYKPRVTIPGPVPNISSSATEIAGAGVTFKAQKHEDHDLLAVNFRQSPRVPPWLGALFFQETCFEIPELCIKYSTQSFLRNLIAYEQCFPSTQHYVTSFAFLMDKLIDTKDDASLLVSSEIIRHKLGAVEEVKDLFNNICCHVVVRDFYYTEEWNKLEKQCNRWWPKMLSYLKRVYRSTTWATLTVIGAAMLFFLTCLQTLYSV